MKNLFSRVEVFNLTSQVISDKILDFLSLGRNHAVGGLSQGSNNHCEIDKLFSYFQGHARETFDQGLKNLVFYLK